MAESGVNGLVEIGFGEVLRNDVEGARMLLYLFGIFNYEIYNHAIDY